MYWDIGGPHVALRHDLPCRTPAEVRAQMPSFLCHLHATDDRIQHALGLIQTSPELKLDAVAATLNLSTSWLRHLFKAQLGLSPSQYVKLLRLERAKILLESSFLTVKEITARVGASDVSHFVRDYKAVYGETPSNSRVGWIVQGTRPSRKSWLQRQLLLPLKRGKSPSPNQTFENEEFTLKNRCKE